MHAVLVQVRIEPARHAEAVTGLREGVVPEVKSTPGFVRGTWIGDQQVGYGLVLRETEDQARQAATMVVSGPDDPVQVVDVHVYEVDAEA